jgi:hypothetical protein
LGRDEKNYPIWAEISERHNSVHKEYQTLLNGLMRAKRSKPVIVDEEKKEAQQVEETDTDKVEVEGRSGSVDEPQEGEVEAIPPLVEQQLD